MPELDKKLQKSIGGSLCMLTHVHYGNVFTNDNMA